MARRSSPSPQQTDAASPLELLHLKEALETSKEELAAVNARLQEEHARLATANNDLTNLLANAQIPILMLGMDLRIRRFTPMAEHVLGLRPSDVGRTIQDLGLAIDVPDLADRIASVIDTLAFQELDVRDRRGYWHSLRIRPYRTLENKIDGAVLVLVDVDRITRARSHAQGILETVSEPLLVIDEGLTVRTASASFLRVYELRPEQIEGRPFFAIAEHGWDLPEIRRFLQPVLDASVAEGELETAVELPGVGRRMLRLRAARILGHDEGPWLLIEIRDVTERRQLETNLKRQIEELAAADRNKMALIATLAHELRNPLASLANAASILGTPGIVRSDAPGSIDAGTTRQVRELMDRQIAAMARMIDDLLDAARISKGQLRLKPEAIDLVDVVNRAVEGQRSGIEARGQTILLSFPEPRIPMDGDPVRLEQVLGNLVSNASKFSGRGKQIRLSVERARGAEGRSEVVVRVVDEGQGIAPELLPNVFDMFVQGNMSLDRTPGGLGIGLTLARALVQMHGGSVEARSDGPGRGSEFVVRLPAAKRVKPASRDASAASALVPPARVLVVEDNRDVAESMATLLRLSGHEVRVAGDGSSAIEAATRQTPDLVFIDIGLPGMDGYQLAQALRAIPELAGTRLVALSGYGQEQAKRRARDAGMDEYFVKPIQPSDLVAVMTRVRPRQP